MGRKSREKRERRALQASVGHGAQAATDPAGGGRPIQWKKMSQVLKEFVGPFAAEDMDLERYKLLVGVGSLVWNLAVMEKSPEESLVQLTGGLDEDEAGRLRVLWAELVKRKQRLFAQDDRFIVSWEATPLRDGFYLEVASARSE